MQLLGKNYFSDNKMPVDQDSLTDETLYHEDGLDALCDAVTKSKLHRSMPAWMTRAGQFIKDNRKHFVVTASVAVIGFAVYLNWALYQEDDPDFSDAALTSGTTYQNGTSIDDLSGQDVLSANTPPQSTEKDGNEDYFAVSLINRQRARDEAIEVLQNVVDGAENLSDVQSEALAGIAKIAADIENEAAIESLVKGKGFENCVAVISGDSANVIVRSSALLPNEITQIQEIVYETAGILPANVKIIEK